MWEDFRFEKRNQYSQNIKRSLGRRRRYRLYPVSSKSETSQSSRRNYTHRKSSSYLRTQRLRKTGRVLARIGSGKKNLRTSISEKKLDRGRYKKIQTDVHSFSARSIVPLISLEIEEDKNWSGVFKEALDIYRKFDGENTLDSSGATIFHTLNQFVMLNLWIDEFGESNLQIFGQTAERWNAYKSILANPKSDFWDDLTTPDLKETRREILIRSFAQTVRYLSKEHGGSPSTWKWKDAHKITFEHPMGKIPVLDSILIKVLFSRFGRIRDQFDESKRNQSEDKTSCRSFKTKNHRSHKSGKLLVCITNRKLWKFRIAILWRSDRTVFKRRTS